MWFARRGYVVVAPAVGYGAAALDDPSEVNIRYSIQKSAVATFRTSVMPDLRERRGQVDHRLHDRAKTDRADEVIVVGQSAGGWAAIAHEARRQPNKRKSVGLEFAPRDQRAAREIK
jgi:dienelactone hydrolase